MLYLDLNFIWWTLVKIDLNLPIFYFEFYFIITIQILLNGMQNKNDKPI